MDGTVIEKLIVEWRADYAKFRQDTVQIKAILGDTAAASKLNSGAFTAAAGSSASFGSALAALGGKALLLGAALKATRESITGIKEAIKLAMDVTESENLFEVALGNMSDSVRAWSESLADSLGVNADEVRKTIGLWYTMGESLGLSGKQALDMSKSLQQLKFDLMSYYNVDGSQADTIIQGLYSGETEPAKRIGVLLTEEVAKRSLVTHGIIKEGQEVNSTTMLYGRYLAMMDQTTKAQGDMARTIDSPANQMRVFESQMRAAKLELGQAFLPVLQMAMPILKDFAHGLKAAAEVFGDFIQAITGRRTLGLKEQVGAVNNATADGAAKWDAYGNAAGSATDKAAAGISKIKAMIFGFDMLNVMGDSEGSSGGNALLPNLPGATDTSDNKSDAGSGETTKKNSDPWYSGMGKTIAEWNKPAISNPVIDVDPLPSDISGKTKEKLLPFIELFENTSITIKKWAWGNQTITKEMAETIATATVDMGGKVKEAIADQTNTSYSRMQEYFKNSSALSEEEEAAILEKIKLNGANKQAETDKQAARINEIYTLAAKENRALTKAEQEEVNSLQEKMKSNAIAYMSESSSEQQKILTYLKVKSGELAAQQAADIVKNSLDAKKAAINAAIDKADGIISEAKRQKEAGIISDEQYKKIVANAEKTRDESIKAAEAMHTKVVEQAKLQAGEHVKEVDWETGQIKTGIQVLKDSIADWWKPIWDNALKSITEGWNGIKKWWKENVKFPEIKMPHFSVTYEKPENDIIAKAFDFLGLAGVPKIDIEWRAGGGFLDQGQMFIAREAGPEMVGRMGSRTAVANNDQIVSGIEGGVYRAVRGALSGNNNGGDIHLTINVGNGTVYDAVIDEGMRRNIRSGKTIIPVGV